MPDCLIALCIGCILDVLFGDPERLPHPVRWIGRLIAALEPLLRGAFPASPSGERAAGAVLVALVVGLSGLVAALILAVCSLFDRIAWIAVASLMCYQMLAARSLRDESMRVYEALQGGSLDQARRAVGRIVGRDTASLDEAGVTRAAVETVAENASDGVIAPLLFMALGGPVAGACYKAASTLDSMVGYKNERYRSFGWPAARLDDVLNFIPSRVAGLFMCAAAPLVGLDGSRAFRTFLRDRLQHASPNAGHPEAACAGALGVRLAGPASYFGRVVDKPFLGDDLRAIEPRDILRANRLMLASAGLACMLVLLTATVLFQVVGL